MSLTRRAALGMLSGAGVSIPVMKHRPTAVHEVPEGDMDVLPSFPILMILKGVGNDRVIKLITSADALRALDPHASDDFIKDCTYRNATGYLFGHPYKLCTTGEVIVPDVAVEFQAIKGASGETMEVTF